MKIRRPGFYWVKHKGKWEVAEWYVHKFRQNPMGCWYLMNLRGPFYANDFEYISQKAISEPKPKNV